MAGRDVWARMAAHEHIMPAIKRIEEVVLTILKGSIKVFEYLDLVLFAEKTDTRETLANFAVNVEPADDHVDVPHSQKTIDARKCFGCGEVNPTDISNIEHQESNGFVPECLFRQQCADPILHTHDRSEEQVAGKLDDKSLLSGVPQVF